MRTVQLAVLLLISSILFTACVPVPPPLTIRLEAEDIQWSQTGWQAKSGQPITVVIENIGSLDHNFVIEELDIELNLSPGETKEISFIFDAAGVYQYLCTVPGHLDAGMIGTITIIE
jgi:uncharacterized cupredoxin-like copper-binding protein